MVINYEYPGTVFVTRTMMPAQGMCNLLHSTRLRYLIIFRNIPPPANNEKPANIEETPCRSSRKRAASEAQAPPPAIKTKAEGSGKAKKPAESDAPPTSPVKKPKTDGSVKPKKGDKVGQASVGARYTNPKRK
jgi:hypothetical protein